MNFSVLISVYKNDDPGHFNAALESVTLRQSLPPQEVIIVVDGPVSDELERVICTWAEVTAPKIKIVRSAKNIGLSRALNLGLAHCQHEYVARMDSDDISLPNRFEKQMEYLFEHRDVSLVGGWYQQYDENMKELLTDRKVPTEFTEIATYSKKRTPFNHVTAIFKRAALADIGGYPEIHSYMEDWWIALRLLNKNHVIANLPEYLVDVRGDRRFIERRGGWSFLQCELQNLFGMHQEGLMSTWDFLANSCIRSAVRILPVGLRTSVYRVIRKM